MNREMLKECIADAKTIKETAIASAKVALEEAFTPQLTAMFAEKLNELEMEEEEMKNESVDETHDEELEENFNLEELLAELSMEEEGVKMEEEGMDGESLDEDLMLEDMSDEEIETLVMQVIDDMIASGKLMPGEGEEEGEEDIEDMGDEEDMEAEEIDIDEILAEMDSKEEIEEGLVDPATLELVGQIASALKMSPEGVMQMIAALPAVVVGAAFAKSPIKDLIKKVKDKIGNKQEPTAEAMETEATNAEMEETINELRKELNEVNLLNAKLLYTNKIFKTKNLTESEKIKVLNTFDKAETVKEVKLVFETLTESLKATTAKKNSIKESLGSASKTISTATPKQPIIEANEAFARMQKIAGLRK